MPSLVERAIHFVCVGQVSENTRVRNLCLPRDRQQLLCYLYRYFLKEKRFADLCRIVWYIRIAHFERSVLKSKHLLDVCMCLYFFVQIFIPNNSLTSAYTCIHMYTYGNVEFLYYLQMLSSYSFGNY